MNKEIAKKVIKLIAELLKKEKVKEVKIVT